MIIKKIFEGKCDEEVHSDFLKFGKGRFEGKYLVEGKKQKDLWSIKTSAEFANTLVRRCLEKVKGSVNITGAIITTLDLTKDIDFEYERIKKFTGINQVLLNGNVEANKIINLMNKYPRVFFALSFKTNDSELKIKAKAPKSGKPGASGDKVPKADFCSLKTSDFSIVKELFFDVSSEWKEAKSNHVLVVEDIIYPKDEKDPKLVREKSKRKGTIIRNLTIDENPRKTEAKFEA